MESEGGNLVSGSKEKIFLIFSDFMTRVTKFEELVAAGSRLLVGFHQGLDILRRPSIDKTSELVESIIKANETKRMISYFEAGCVNTYDTVQNMSKLHSCQLGLQDQLSRAKCILNELECLVEDAIQTVAESLPHLQDKDIEDELDPQANTYDKEETVSTGVQKVGIADYAVTMGVIYSMVKQDYTMQERIVSSLNIKSSSGELETYCLMWSLRPFVNDEIMLEAWKLIP
ncbi:hypothetical protein F0562_003132 [Nyssa sinensis]|uniref:DUF7795 domain-containing protein n=1 Tax=Nyssa sinensis TaxID=561372 RepID=A0A5J5BY48_9ASTE|nr:hypothetical protein F0562_003132 [Nyssa sinensis]